MGDIVVGFFRQLGEGSHSQALVLMGDFNHCSVCWRENAAGIQAVQGVSGVHQ